MIAFIGSVFSPYYAQRRRRGLPDARNHCALNVALYSTRGKRWAMTERNGASLRVDSAALSIGPSRLAWDGVALNVDIDEIAVPLPAKIQGCVRLYPSALQSLVVPLDAAGLHRWRPIAPCARVEVNLSKPRMRWSGTGYFDCNAGDAPLEQSFAGWTWSRANVHGGSAVVYDVQRRDGSNGAVALRFDAGGGSATFSPPPLVRLPRTRWLVQRSARAEPAHTLRVVKTLEDTPFYARSLLSVGLLGEPVLAVHESLSLDRFRTHWVQMLLPFRMPRALR